MRFCVGNKAKERCNSDHIKEFHLLDYCQHLDCPILITKTFHLDINNRYATESYFQLCATT